jgi:hypothetical protein
VFLTSREDPESPAMRGVRCIGRTLTPRESTLIPIPDRFESNPTLASGVWIVATMPSRIQSDLEAV